MIVSLQQLLITAVDLPSARNKRQALVLGKGFKPLAVLQDAVQADSSQEAGAASDRPKDTPEPAAVGMIHTSSHSCRVA